MTKPHSNCDCADISKQRKALVQKSVDFGVILRGGLAIISLICIAKSAIPTYLAKWIGSPEIVSYIHSILYVGCALLVILCSRFALVGTCCLPSIQLRGSALTAVLEQADQTMEQRIFSKRNELAERLAAAVRFKTISWDPEDTENSIDYSQFTEMHKFFEEKYAKVHKTLQKTVINQYSLVYKWEGTDPSLKPYLLTAHQDVVPVTGQKWTVSIDSLKYFSKKYLFFPNYPLFNVQSNILNSFLF